MPAPREKTQHRDPNQLVSSLMGFHISAKMLAQIALAQPCIPVKIRRFGLYDPVR